MKSQGLPIQTIALIIIVIVVLAAVLIFFYSQFSTNTNTQNRQTLISKCQTIVSQIQGNNPTNKSDAEKKANALGYCNIDQSTGLRCNDTMSPKITLENGVCTLNCDDSSATCT